MIAKGEPWGQPASGPPEHEVSGTDATLAAAARAAAGALFVFRPDPDSDFAKSVGLGASAAATTEVPVDALEMTDLWAVNMVVLGTPPDRLGRFSRALPIRATIDGRVWFDGPVTTLVIASGQFLRGGDVVPRGHPGDGRAEFQAYRLRRGERVQMRRRLADGSHVPHPRIDQRSGHRIEVTAARPVAAEADGVALGITKEVVIEVVPAAFRLLV